MILRAIAVIIALVLPSLSAAELKIVGPDSVPVGGTAFFKLEGAKAGDPFDYFSATGSLVVLFDIETSPVGVVTGERAGTVTLVAVKYDAESKKIQRVLRVVPIGPAPPTPVPPGPTPPTPVPPGPTPPPVVEGKRSVLIIRESAESTPHIARLIVALRTPPHADYLKSKGHTLSVLDDDNATPEVQAWREQWAGHVLPVVLIIDPVAKTLVHKWSLPASVTADRIIALLKEHGG